MRAATGPTSRSGGFTLVEMAISMGILVLLLASVFAITVEVSSFLGDTDAENAVQTEAHRAYTRLAEILRKSGRVEVGGIEYPRTNNGGEELEFKVLIDIDGNGYAFEEGTGKLEWDSGVYTVKLDGGGNLDIYSGADKVYPLARFVSGLRFETVKENSALHLKEISLAFETSKAGSKGTATFPVEASVHMRN